MKTKKISDNEFTISLTEKEKTLLEYFLKIAEQHCTTHLIFEVCNTFIDSIKNVK